jgi:hypothetical protein
MLVPLSPILEIPLVIGTVVVPAIAFVVAANWCLDRYSRRCPVCGHRFGFGRNCSLIYPKGRLERYCSRIRLGQALRVYYRGSQRGYSDDL